MRHFLFFLFVSSLFFGCRLIKAPVIQDEIIVVEEDSTLVRKVIRPYQKIISDTSRSDRGLFTVHQIKGRLYFEIPDSLFEREMLLISRVEQVPADLSPYVNAGSETAEQVLRWQRIENQVLLRKVSYQSVANDSLPIAQSVRRNNFEPILASFKIEAFNADSQNVVIDVTSLFRDDVPAISGLTAGQRAEYGIRRLDPSRSFIDDARSFPLNLNVRHTMTYEATKPPSNAHTGTLSMQMFQSMILLPKTPMMPRLADRRVGYFSIDQVDFGSDEQKADTRTYIRRWRLEPRDPVAYARGELVEPVKPIVYYLDPATPEIWRPYIKKGIEDWNSAFEAAGFKNAIIARDPPSPEENPDFSPEDVRYSTVRYVANLTRNAMGPSVSDPRSGEIIESDIIWYHNHLRSYRNRLLIETGAANPAARSLKIDEALIGETMRQVIAHEIGHALGLPHNMKASSAFSVDSLRSPAFTERYGVAPSIMDYARQNYIAQPEDGVTHFVRKIGPYDHYAIEWGYRVYPGLQSPEEEKPFLDRLILAHAGNPFYQFGSSSLDPRTQTEDLGDDHVLASTYAVANLRRVLPYLEAWTSKPGEDYGDLQELYGEFVAMWNRYMYHVLSVIGGVHEELKTTDQTGPVYTFVPREEQEQALQFLTQNVFETPTWMLDQDILRRIEPAGAVDRIREIQVRLLVSLLDPDRMQRLIEAEVFAPETAYPLLTFLQDVKQGVWSDLQGREPIDAFRRNLQRGYIERAAELLKANQQGPAGTTTLSTPDRVSQSDVPAFIRGQLTELSRETSQAVQRKSDPATRYHLQDITARIDTILKTE